MQSKIIWVFKGVVLGCSALAPGVSMGTLALAMNIYEKIIFLKDRNFLMCLSLGFASVVFLGAGFVSYLLKFFPLETYSLFIGLVLASLPVVFKNIKKGWRSAAVVVPVIFVFGALLNFSVGFGPQTNKFWIILSSFIGGFSAVLPGVSGSMVLLMMGVYDVFLQSLKEFNIIHLTLFLIGGLSGLSLAFFSMNWLLKNKKSLVFCVLCGLILAGLPSLFAKDASLLALLDNEPLPGGVFDLLKIIFFMGLGFSVLFFIEKKLFRSKNGR